MSLNAVKSSPQIDDAEKQEFLSFALGGETYALDIMCVKEIRGYGQVTKIANAPDYIKGVINLRGDIVPIIDLRIKFNVGQVSYNEFTIVIMLTIDEKIVGIVVDEVSDVFKLSSSEIKSPPEFGVAFDSAYLLGLATVDEEMAILVNIQKLIKSDELALYETAENLEQD